MQFKVTIEDIWNGDVYSPDFVYNRFDLFDRNNCKMVQYEDAEKNVTYRVLVHFIDRENAEIGLWLNPIPEDAIHSIIKRIFHEYKSLKVIQYKNAYHSLGDAQTRNHFRIYLPETVEELDSRLSAKGRYNIRREKRILDQEFGGYSISVYETERAPDDVLEAYYTMKKITHHINYKISPREYMKQQKVSHIYVLRLGESNKVDAIILSCEQCPVVYIENLTYDTAYAKNSLGQILYDIYLKELIKKRKKEIFLLGGDYEYKRRYGSVEEVTYNGVIYRSPLFKYRLVVENQVRKMALDIYLKIPYEHRQIIKKILR